jgi:hypothetical protein
MCGAPQSGFSWDIRRISRITSGLTPGRPRARENPGDPDSPHRGAKHLQPPDEVADELREPVHRLGQTDERVGPFLIEGGDEERPGGLGHRPTTGGSQIENRQSLDRWIVRPFLGREVLHAGVLGPALLAQQPDLLLEAVGFGPSAERSVHAF